MIFDQAFAQDLRKTVLPIVLRLALVGLGIYALIVSSVRIADGVQCDHPLSIMLILHNIIVIMYAGASFLTAKLDPRSFLRKITRAIALFFVLALLTWLIIMLVWVFGTPGTCDSGIISTARAVVIITIIIFILTTITIIRAKMAATTPTTSSVPEESVPEFDV